MNFFASQSAWCAGIVWLSVVAPVVVRADDAPYAKNANTRTFDFTYSATVSGLQPGQSARIWLPVPPSNEDQEVQVVSEMLPGKNSTHREPKYGNKIWYIQAQADQNGTIPVSVTYRVQRREVKGEPKPTDEPKDAVNLFLQPDALVPLGGKPLDLIKDKSVPDNQLQAGRLFYDVVNKHMRYSKEGTGWGRGDAVWACDSKYGNCSDFHSLFISLARSHKIPAKFEIGFPLPTERGAGDIPGYHCWAKFRPEGRGWVPVDISEANKSPDLTDYYFGTLSADRVTFSTGRDLILVPKQDGPPLNFFVYPYVEVDGKPLAADKVQRKFSFRDVKDGMK